MSTENELDESQYAPSSPGGVTGGIVSGGMFGEDSLVPHVHPTTRIFGYMSKINPNIFIAGGVAVSALFGINSMIQSLGKANPNNAMLETQRIQASTNEQIVTATTDSLKAVVNQRPACIAIVCNMPDQPTAQETQTAQQYPDLYQPVPVAPAPVGYQQVQTPPTDGNTVAYWDYHQRIDPQYVSGWTIHCIHSEWASQECYALSGSLNNGI